MTKYIARKFDAYGDPELKDPIEVWDFASVTELREWFYSTHGDCATVFYVYYVNKYGDESQINWDLVLELLDMDKQLRRCKNNIKRLTADVQILEDKNKRKHEMIIGLAKKLKAS